MTEIVEAQALRDAALGLAASGLTGYTQRGVDPTIVRDELYGLISHAITDTPRSRQKEIGPSEIGSPCDRKLAFKIAGIPAARPLMPAWRATVGTAVHAWLAGRLQAHNLQTKVPRWMLETRLYVGEIADADVYGSCDCYDILSAGAIDWKIVGPTSLRKYRTSGPGQQYRVQVHTYGKGIEDLGLPIDYVAIFFLPSNGELNDGVFWHEPYDRSIAEAGLQRVTNIHRALNLVGPARVLPAMPTADAPCTYCPWLNPLQAARNPAAACAGHPGRTSRADELFALAGKKSA